MVMIARGINLICSEAFGPFKVGDRFYCFSIEEEHFVVWSSRLILGQNEFKISNNHKSKFRRC